MSGLLICKRIKLIASTDKYSAVAEMVDRAKAKWAEKWRPAVLCPFPWEAGSPSDIMLPRPRSTSVPSGILIHPTIWPQYTNVTDRQTGLAGQRSCSIGRTVTYNGHPIRCADLGTLKQTYWCRTMAVAHVTYIASC